MKFDDLMKDPEKILNDLAQKYFDEGYVKGSEDTQFLCEKALKSMGVSIETFSEALESIVREINTIQDLSPSEKH